MMIYVVIGFLWMSLLIYLLMGGADYGAGILELSTYGKQKAEVRKTSYQVMGPVWEANHMWLIIAVVILFVGFPKVYTTVSVNLHIPLVIMLFGIIARGTSFTFRNYDAVKDHWEQVYSKTFMYSSFITPFFLGVIAGSAVSGTIDPEAITFSAAYIYSWVSWFSFSVGLFTVSLCGFLAAIYLSGEVNEHSVKRNYIIYARRMNIAMIVFVIMIFISAYHEKVPMLHWVFGNAISIIAVFSSVFSWILLWVMISGNKISTVRFLAGLMVTALLIAVTYSHYPDIILLKNRKTLSLLDQSGSGNVIDVLGSALLIGSVFILPALFYLVYSFGRKDGEVLVEETLQYIKKT